MKSRDGLFKERGEIIYEMSGISPKMELYKKLEARLKEVDHLLGGNTASCAQRTKSIKNT